MVAVTWAFTINSANLVLTYIEYQDPAVNAKNPKEAISQSTADSKTPFAALFL